MDNRDYARNRVIEILASIYLMYMYTCAAFLVVVDLARIYILPILQWMVLAFFAYAAWRILMGIVE